MLWMSTWCEITIGRVAHFQRKGLIAKSLKCWHDEGSGAGQVVQEMLASQPKKPGKLLLGEAVASRALS